MSFGMQVLSEQSEHLARALDQVESPAIELVANEIMSEANPGCCCCLGDNVAAPCGPSTNVPCVDIGDAYDCYKSMHLFTLSQSIHPQILRILCRQLLIIPIFSLPHAETPF